MTAIDFSGGFRQLPVWHGRLGALRTAWAGFQRRRQERRAVVAISHLPRHVIRDIGFDPEQVHEAVGGGWDAVDPVGFRILLPKGAHILTR